MATYREIADRLAHLTGGVVIEIRHGGGISLIIKTGGHRRAKSPVEFPPVASPSEAQWPPGGEVLVAWEGLRAHWAPLKPLYVAAQRGGDWPTIVGQSSLARLTRRAGEVSGELREPGLVIASSEAGNRARLLLTHRLLPGAVSGHRSLKGWVWADRSYSVLEDGDDLAERIRQVIAGIEAGEIGPAEEPVGLLRPAEAAGLAAAEAVARFLRAAAPPQNNQNHINYFGFSDSCD